MSAIFYIRADLVFTPFIVLTNPFWLPKSVVIVRIAIAID